MNSDLPISGDSQHREDGGDASNPPTGPGTKIRYFGDYELLEEIARGGMGVVYRARQQSLNRLVALKMILSGHLASEAEVKRFRTEAEAAANLDHPHIVPIYEVGEHEGLHYFAMRLVEGGNLAQQIGRFGNDLTSAARLMVTVAQAVHHAHQRRILHRDLKPSNILLDAEGQPHVTDFGLARLVTQDSDLTQSGSTMGTPNYMSPEQAQGRTKQLTTASDVFSLGAVFYQMLTGRAPFRADTPLETVRLVVEAEPVPPNSVNRKVDRDLETICLKCLEKEPDKRYGSAEAFAGDLERWLAHEPIQARSTTAWDRTVKWFRRKPAVAALTCALVASMLLGLGAALWEWRQADIARRLAEEKAIAATKASQEAKIQSELAEEKAAAETKALEEARIQRELAEERAAAETKALEEAKIQRELAVDARTQIQLQKIDELSEGDNIPALIANLSFFLRKDSTNHILSQSLINALNSRDYVLLISSHLQGTGGVSFARFDAKARRLFSVANDGSALVRDLQTGETLLTLPTKSQVKFADFSLDGTLLVTLASDGSTGMWDVTAGKVLWEIGKVRVVSGQEPATQNGEAPTEEALLPRPPPPTNRPPPPTGLTVVNPNPAVEAEQPKPICAHFSPDGHRLFVAINNDDVMCLDPSNGQTKWIVNKVLFSPYVVLATFSSSSNQLVTVSTNYEALLLETSTGKIQNQPLKHEATINAVLFSSDGLRVITVSDDRTARIWDASTGQPVTGPLKHEARVLFAQFSPDSQRAITVSGYGAAHIWDVASGKPLIHPFKDNGSIVAARWSPEGLRLLATYADGSARIWNAQTGQPLSQPFHHGSQIQVAQFSQDAQELMTISSNGLLRRWNILPSRALVVRLTHSDKIASFCFSPNNQHLLTASDKLVRIWDPFKGRCLKQVSAEARPVVSDWPPMPSPRYTNVAAITAAAFSPDGRWVATACIDKVSIFNPCSDKAAVSTKWHASITEFLDRGYSLPGVVMALDFSPDGRRLLTVSENNAAQVYNAETGEHLSGDVWNAKTNGQVSGAFGGNGLPPLPAKELFCGSNNFSGGDNFKIITRFSPDGGKALIASWDGSTQVWDIQSRKPLGVGLFDDKGVTAAAFSADGKRVLRASADRTVRIWDVATTNYLTLNHADCVNFAEFSPNGNKVLTASADGTACLWDSRTGQRLIEPLRHKAGVTTARFSRDGQRVITASQDRTARLWDSRTGSPLTRPIKHDQEVIDAQFSPDGQYVATASGSNVFVREESAPAPPVPVWVLDLAEAIAGLRVTVPGTTEIVPPEEILKIKDRILANPSRDAWTKWAGWFFTDFNSRTISPTSPLTIPDYVRLLIDRNRIEALQEATMLSPTNGLAFARLAKCVLSDDPNVNPRRDGEADFFSRRAVQLSPNDSEVLRIRSEVAKDTKTVQPH